MHRIISVETSRNAGLASGEFVSKRLCCSFLLTVAFFCVIGGFLLGRFVTDKSHHKAKGQLDEITKRLYSLDDKLKNTFHQLLLVNNYTNCSAILSRIKCEHLTAIIHQQKQPVTSQNSSIKHTLDLLNNCFDYDG